MNQIFGSTEGNNAYLVPSQVDTLTNLSTTTWLRSKLGDPAKLPSVKSDLEGLFGKITDTTEKVRRLAADRSRTKTQAHMAAEQLATDLSSDVRRYAQLFDRKAIDLQDEGQKETDRVLGPRDQYGYLQSEIRGWIRDQVKTPEGMQRVSDAYKSNLQTASAIYSSPHFLIDVSETLHTTMRLKAVELFAPKGFKLLNEGIDLAGKVKNYETVVSRIHQSYYSGELVAAAKASHVEV